MNGKVSFLLVNDCTLVLESPSGSQLCDSDFRYTHVREEFDIEE